MIKVYIVDTDTNTKPNTNSINALNVFSIKNGYRAIFNNLEAATAYKEAVGGLLTETLT